MKSFNANILSLKRVYLSAKILDNGKNTPMFNPYIQMKSNLIKLIIFFCVFYLFTETIWALNAMGRTLQFGLFWKGMVGAFTASTFISFLCVAVLTYCTFYYLYPKLNLLKTVMFYGFITVPAAIGLRFLLEEVIFYTFTKQHNYVEKMFTPLHYILDNVYFVVHYGFIGIIYYFIEYNIITKQQQQELQLQVRNAELSFLKSQINPHFLFNSLNNIYTLIYQGSPNALETVSKLSQMLRYMIYNKEEKIPLQTEAEYLRNFIELQLLRYNYAPNTIIRLPDNINAKYKIPPLVLIPLVENAFKHGDLKDKEVPLFIELLVDHGEMIFTVKNKIAAIQKDTHEGIGLENVRKRMNLLYKDKYVLKIDHQSEIFHVSLKITFNE
jgi:two-component system, LytTR family, sensor kinase